MKIMVIQLSIGALGTASKVWKRGWKVWKLKDESRPFNLQHFNDRQEYWRESRRPEENGHNSCEGSSANVGVKKSREAQKKKKKKKILSVLFYGISTMLGYLMPNPALIYILDTYDLNSLKYFYIS